MPKVTFITSTGSRTTLENVEGNLMEIARDHDIEGIDGDCGGVCSCSTCHVYIAQSWQDKLPPTEELEADTLSFNDNQQENSRLSCQIEVTEALDGLEVIVPESD